MTGETITITRTDAIDILGILEDNAETMLGTGHLAGVILNGDAARVLTGALYGDDGDDGPTPIRR